MAVQPTQAKRSLIRGASIITMDAQGDLPQGDILITDDTLTEIALRIHVDDAEVIDGSGYIVIPGLVNAHMHTWQTALRGLASNWTLSCSVGSLSKVKSMITSLTFRKESSGPGMN
jgi:cytosine/adenosine deaminase-related metal-dependent hydrolase